MGVYISNFRLPSEYQEVEYIGRNGNNYIDTGWIPTTNFKINLGYKIADSGYRYVMMGNYGQNDVHSISLEINSGSVTNNSVRFYCGTTSITQFYSSNSLNLNSFNDITITAPGTINLNGTTTTGSMYSGSYDSKSCYLFMIRDTATSSWNTFSHNSFISYCKIYEGSTLVRDFVPCYRKSDNVIGLYDLVNNQFYTNSGTGTFSKGNDVTMVEMKNAYIGEVWTPNANTLAYFPMQGDNLDKVGTFTLDVSGTQQTIGRKFTSQTSLNTTPTGIKTMSGWVKIASATPSGGSSGQCGILASYGNYLCYFNSSSDVKAKSIYCYANNTDYYKNVNIIDNSWHHIAITNNGSTIVGYVDGVSYALGNSSLPGLSKLLVFCSGGNTIDVTLSEIILENKQWTQSEVAHYFDITKGNYGIS